MVWQHYINGRDQSSRGAAHPCYLDHRPQVKVCVNNLPGLSRKMILSLSLVCVLSLSSVTVMYYHMFMNCNNPGP